MTRDKEYLYSLFERGDTPTDQDFRDLIDSLWTKGETINADRIGGLDERILLVSGGTGEADIITIVGDDQQFLAGMRETTAADVQPYLPIPL